MSKITLNPYFNFAGGKAKEAAKYYQSVFGGELDVMKFGDVPGAANGKNDGLVMHSDLQSDDARLMFSDGMRDADVVKGTNIALSLSGDDEAKLKGYFEKLGGDGEVVEPLAKAPWGDQFGMVKDKYDVLWMFNVGSSQ